MLRRFRPRLRFRMPGLYTSGVRSHQNTRLSASIVFIVLILAMAGASSVRAVYTSRLAEQ
ncbi:MAG: hypothetical protein NZ699_04310 [Roseiflexus sp.]|nr:hypothetical protein [Roseiflexus sp.]MCS7288337.1 hypothetical protein [Roseiflexus sp.]MDW8233384.1 hypothetical protein [Roseiflexaceae bacterium]